MTFVVVEKDIVVAGEDPDRVGNVETGSGGKILFLFPYPYPYSVLSYRDIEISNVLVGHNYNSPGPGGI